MIEEYYQGWEVMTIPEADPVSVSKLRYVESEWMICIDGPSRSAIEYNRKTGEMRPYDYAKAMREMLGGFGS